MRRGKGARADPDHLTSATSRFIVANAQLAARRKQKAAAAASTPDESVADSRRTSVDATPAETPAETPTPPAEPAESTEPEPIPPVEVKEEVKAVVFENGAGSADTAKLEKELKELKERISAQNAEIERLKSVSFGRSGGS